MNDQKIRLASYSIAGIGAVDSIYLSYSKLADQEVFCGSYGGCETVNNSSYAEIAGIPIAILGIGTYLFIIGLLYLEQRSRFWKEWSPMLVFGITLFGVIYSAFLTYVEIAILRAICPYCVISALAMLALFVLSVLRLVHLQAEVNPI